MPAPFRLGRGFVVLFGALSGIVAGAEPVRAEVSLGVRPELWVGGWAAAVAAFSVLYAFDRRHRASMHRAARRVSVVPMTRGHIVARAETTPGSESAPRPPGRRSIEELIKRKPGTPANAPLPFPLGRSEAAPQPEPESALLRRLRERGELLARVAAPVTLPDASADDEPEVLAEEEAETIADEALDALPLEEARAPAETVQPEAAARGPGGEPRDPGPLARCQALRADGRFTEALRVARDGLARYSDAPGPLLLELSRCAFALGRNDEAIDAARDALFVWRSPGCVEHLMRMLTLLHRFEPADGDGLRRAAERHPDRPLLRHAVGVFELEHGSRAAGEAELRAALALDPEPAERQAIERDLVALLGPGLAGTPRA